MRPWHYSPSYNSQQQSAQPSRQQLQQTRDDSNVTPKTLQFGLCQFLGQNNIIIWKNINFLKQLSSSLAANIGWAS
jgi:hypothetical protein